jgi:AcrR family transcriptional regulator
MGTRETQNKILDTAIELFNAEGTAKISSNRIAMSCNISKGNLHYHFKSKEEIILSIWNKITDEIEQDWGDDVETPTIRHMAELTQRQFRLIWRYRFFYRELTTLLEHDPELKYRFRRMRAKRIKVIEEFFHALIKNNVIKPQTDKNSLKSLIKIAWLITDYWISFIGIDDKAIDMPTMQEGFELMMHLFSPMLTEEAKKDIPESFRIFSVDG